jgi:hypothetical protein
MDRRDALKSLASVLAGTTLTPVTTRDATDVTLIIFRLPADRLFSDEQCERLHAVWKVACEGTTLEGIKTLVLRNGVEVEFVRTHIRP